MKNFLIIVGILAVTYLAWTDTMEKYKEIESIAATTPAQVEMKSQIQNNKGSGIDDKRFDGLDEGINQPDKQLMKEMKEPKVHGEKIDLKHQIPNITSP